MRVLLVWPKFPDSFWSFEKVLELVGKRSLVPPLGLATVAGLLPQDWEFRLTDRNIEALTDNDLEWCDIIMVSAMIVQRDDFEAVIQEAKAIGKPVAVGGPYVTSVPEVAEAAGADYLVLDEGEITIPPFVEDLLSQTDWVRAEGQPPRRYSAKGQKPEMDATKLPRFDLFDFDAYDMMSIQFSRGCPFLCEFCDIITLYGRKPRTKPPSRLLLELDELLRLGWKGGILLVDDNFIGNKKNVKNLLLDLAAWQKDNNYPFFFDTEASVDLATEDDLLDLMHECQFASVFLGIETPDPESLELTRKHQNNRGPMSESIAKIQGSGLRVMAGFIIGFDGEKPGAGKRIVEFVEQCNITHGLLSMLQALPNTGLWTRLTNEGRLLSGVGDINQTSILNFTPTRPMKDIATEFIEAYDAMYEPSAYIDRVCRFLLEKGKNRPDTQHLDSVNEPGFWKQLWREPAKTSVLVRALLVLAWKNGVVRSSRSVFWRCLVKIVRDKPDAFVSFMVFVAHNEHFIHLKKLARAEIEASLPEMSSEIFVKPEPEPTKVTSKKRILLSSHFERSKAV